jgi:uncharacterized protein YgfB (UPF0149 family)
MAKLIGDMVSTYEYLINSIRCRREYAQQWSNFGSSLCKMAQTQLPTIQEPLDELVNLFEEIAQIHRDLADNEERNAEDFRDVFERFDVVFQTNEENTERRMQYEDAKNALQAIQARITLLSRSAG